MAVGKLLFFESTISGAFQDGKSGLPGARDGRRGRKFQYADRLNRLSKDSLSASWAVQEGIFASAGRMLESVAAESAGQIGGSIEIQRHGSGSLIRLPTRFELKRAERLEAGISGGAEPKGCTFQRGALNFTNFESHEATV